MKKRQIINIVNFIRACEPRMPVDLHLPVAEQVRLMKEHHLRGTFLLQYDALLEPWYTDLMKSLDPEQFELGVWHEIVQPECEACGIPWTGRYPWDWHVHCGFSDGYTKAQREVLADELFAKFKEIFGYYPRVIGSWLLDSHTIRYLSDKYGLDAVCDCKEQYGTDGYTLWGGYYGQAYYPSRTNYFMPAQTKEELLPAPLFRMLGSDPVYQFDTGMDAVAGAQKVQGVVTLEPVYTGSTGGGGVPHWVDWFMKENFNGDCLTFGYAQAGQENPFGWDHIGPGLTYQFELFEKLEKEGKIECEPLGATGRWFKETYRDTPPSAITAHDAYDDPEKSSVWYSTKNYRANIYCDHDVLRIRDLHVFSEKFPDPFENTVCEANEATYETLPLADGNRHTGNGIIAGIYIKDAETGKQPDTGKLVFEDRGNGIAALTYGSVSFVLTESAMTVKAPGSFILENRMGKTNDHVPEVISRTERDLTLSYSGAEYTVHLAKGSFRDAVTILSEDGEITAEFSVSVKE